MAENWRVTESGDPEYLKLEADNGGFFVASRSDVERHIAVLLGTVDKMGDKIQRVRQVIERLRTQGYVMAIKQLEEALGPGEKVTNGK